MRYRDFKSNLNEEEINNYLDKIDQTAKEKQGMPADLFNRLKSVTDKLKLEVEKVLKRQQQQPNDVIGEDSAGFVSPEEVDELTDAIEKMLAPQLTGITDQNEVKRIRDLYIPQYKEILEEFGAIKREKFEKERLDFMQDIDEQLKRLAEKIDGHVVSNWEAPDSKMTKAEIKKEKTRIKTQDSLMDLFDTLFRRKIKSGQLSEDEALTFVTGAANGEVIEMSDLVKATDGYGRIDDYVDSKHKKVYNIIIEDLLNSMPAATGGNLGPGELALAALGNPTEKALDKGDLIINGEAYEIKGGSTGETSSGGRLNSGAVKDGKSAFNAIGKTLKSNKELWKAINELAAEKQLAGGTLVSGFTLKGVKNYEKIFNKAGYNKPQSIQILDQIIQDIVMNYDEVMQKTDEYGSVKSQYDNLMDNSMTQTKDGVELNFKSIMKAVTFVQYHSYNLADGVEKILLINKTNRTFLIIRNGQDFMDKIDSGFAHPAKNMSITATDPQTASFHWTTK